jgi:predicted site-specific integrase-resolvase
MTTPPAPVYSTPSVAKLLGVSRATARRYAVAIGVPQGPGGSYMWTSEHIDAARAEQQAAAAREIAGLRNVGDAGKPTEK